MSSSVFSNSCHRLVAHVSDTLLTGSPCGALEGVRPWTAGLPTSSKSNVLILLSLDVPPKSLPGGPKSGMGIVPIGVDHFLYPQARVCARPLGPAPHWRGSLTTRTLWPCLAHSSHSTNICGTELNLQPRLITSTFFCI